MADPTTPLESIGVLAHQQEEIAEGLVHHELYTVVGLLTVLWHGDPSAPRVVVAAGGAMGGLLGPADGLYHRLGVELTGTDSQWQLLRLSYRMPNAMGACVMDMAAVCELACRNGGERVALLGHSFGGAVAIRTAIALPDVVAAVATFATQSAGCEIADRLHPDLPLLFVHGERDELLSVDCSAIVREIAGHGDLVVIPGAGHLLANQGPALLDRLLTWLPAALA